MKAKGLYIVTVVLLISAAVHAQTSIAGKWQTDNVPAALAAQAAGIPAEPGRAGIGGYGIMLELKVEGRRVSGKVTEIGNPPVQNIEMGTIDGKVITWVTQPRGVTWTLEITDDNTLTLTNRATLSRGQTGARSSRGGAPIVFHRAK